MPIKEFYYLCITLSSLIGAMGLFAFWRIIAQKDREGSRGIFFIVLAVLSWAVVGFYNLLDPQAFSIINTITNRVLSAFSNLCLLAALPYFTESFVRIKDKFKIFRDGDQWLISLLVFFSLLTVAFVLLDNLDKEGSYVNKYIIIIVDSLLSVLAMFLAGYSIYHSIKKYWLSPLSRYFVVAVFSLFLGTQIAFPVIGFSFGQDSAVWYYHVTLAVFIVSLGLLVTILLSYYSLVVYEIGLAAAEVQTEPQKASEKFAPTSLLLGYNESEASYFISIAFVSNLDPTHQVTDRIEFKKVLKPFCHWLVFAFAHRSGIGLEHSDMAIIKFRMLSLWNKEAHYKLGAEDLFDINDIAVNLKFPVGQVQLEGTSYLHSRFVIRDTFKAFLENFYPQIDAKTMKSIKSNPEELDKMVTQLFELKA
jgi:hypothetical protein